MNDEPCNLILHLNGEFFDQIASGTKPEEYRRVTPYWTRRIVFRPLTGIHLFRGYPPNGRWTPENHLFRYWGCPGYRVTTITHSHFGPDPVKVYAINVTHVRRP